MAAAGTSEARKLKTPRHWAFKSFSTKYLGGTGGRPPPGNLEQSQHVL